MVQLGVFVLATVVALRLTGTIPHLPAVLCTVVPLLFATPIGLSYLDRGQYDLYVAASYVLVFAYLFRPRPSLVLAAGLLAAVKVTALPLLGALALFMLIAGPRGSRRFWLLAAPLVAVASFLLLPDPRLIEHLRYWETAPKPEGASFAYAMPAKIGKALPILTALIVAGVLRWRHRSPEPDGALARSAAPLALALAIEGAAVGTVSWEYRAVSLLGLVPALAIWAERAAGVPPGVKAGTVVGFALFLVAALHVHNLTQALRPERVVVWVYLAAAVIFTALATIVAWRRPEAAPGCSVAV